MNPNSFKTTYIATFVIAVLTLSGVLKEVTDISGTNDSWLNLSEFGLMADVVFLAAVVFIVYFAVLSVKFIRYYSFNRRYKVVLSLDSFTLFIMTVFWIYFLTNG